MYKLSHLFDLGYTRALASNTTPSDFIAYTLADAAKYVLTSAK